MPTIADIVAFLKKTAPLELAADWDNVGLLLGDAAAPAERVMTCLTVTPESAEEAIAAGAQLIVTHHPILFRGAKRITTATSEGRMLLGLARAGIAVYSPHTAFDNAAGGINDVIARRLGLEAVVPLRAEEGSRLCKVVVFVPDKDLRPVSDAMFSAGAGNIGQYRECSFRLAGTGTFFGTDETNPTLGEKGRREEVNEWRLEVVCPEGVVDRVVAALRTAHSYEEPAYDVYPLRPERKQGVGRIGQLAQPATLATVARLVKEKLNACWMQVVGHAEREIRRIAIVCGAGGEFWKDARANQADAFVTGEMRFHDCLAARSENLAILLPGHHATERCGIEDLAERLTRHFPGVRAWASERESDPLSSF